MAIFSLLLPALFAFATFETSAIPSSSGPAPAPASGGSAPAPPPAHWDYTTMDKWGNEHGFEKCSEGHHQSPINIDSKTIRTTSNPDGYVIPYDSTPLSFSAGACDSFCWNITNNGHAIQLNPKSPYFSVMDGKVYKLLQMHFHTPSEHWIDSNFSPLELHFVHQSPADGQLMVVGLMFDYDDNANTPFLDIVQRNVSIFYAYQQLKFL